jgi:hypothetical protein
MTLKSVIDTDKSAQINSFCAHLRPAFFSILPAEQIVLAYSI